MSRETVRLSVRAVVETTLHESDLAPASGALARMQEGAVAHRARQQAGAALDKTYLSEVALSADYAGDTVTLHITGRADAICLRDDGVYVIEEIKLGAPDAPLLPAHRAQAAMYAHMLCRRDQLPRAAFTVLYVDTAGQPLAAYSEELDAAALAAEFDALCAPALLWEEKKCARRQRRDAALAAFPFPHAHYRAGQKKFAQNVYVAVRERKRLFAQAPTGVGKTVAALYPALRALGDGHCARILYLAARTTGRRSAMQTMAQLEAAGVMTVEITAKDKVCFLEKRDCRPESCPYAKGYFDRLSAALEAALHLSRLGGGEIAALARAHSLCPFELSLALAQLGDVVVCDYNYVFDPMVASDALLSAPGGACLLIDEAHQLAPRVRDTYSAALDLRDLREIRRESGRAAGRKTALYRALTAAIAALGDAAAQADFEALKAPPEKVVSAMEAVQRAAGEALAAGADASALDAFSLAAGFLFAAERFDARWALIASAEEKRMELALLDASPEILQRTKRARGTVFFSATLAPFDAAKKTLGSGEGDACLMLPSPFDPAQLDARIEPIDIRYASREQTAPRVAEAIAAHLRAHAGNTLVFFPSYAYQSRIHELLMGMENMLCENLLRETRGMTEDEKNALLGAFEKSSERVVLLGVLGGAFSEGIDLPGDALKNVIVVSTGMPQPDARVRAMQEYYDSIGENGFDLAMTLPGMVRAVQAAGRLIRTDSDTGSLLLIDSRYLRRREREILDATLIGPALDRSRQTPL